MSTRSERLNRLTIGSSCHASWGDMAGGDSQRFCQACSRHVLDFARLTEREIAVRMEASRGRLCARLTRIDDRLITLPPAALEPCGPTSERRAPSVAAALVTAFLGVGGGALQASATSGSQDVVASSPIDAAGDASSSPVASPGEDEQIVGEAPANVRGEGVTMGIILPSADPLRVAFENSNLTILATVGASLWVERDEDGYGQVATELRIQEVLKGSVNRRFRSPFRSVFYLHHESIPEAAEGTDADSLGSDTPTAPGPTPGATVLAFLEPSTERRRLSGFPVYELEGWGAGVKELSGPEIAAYRERLSALTEILGPDEIPPAELAEWLVATVEDPLTRAEVLEELDDEPILEALTETQKQRLLRSLLSTDRLTEADLGLYDFVRDAVLEETHREDAAAIRAWLLRQLRRDVAETENPQHRFSQWSAVAERLGNGALQERAAEAEAAVQAIYDEEFKDDFSEANLERVEQLVRPVAEEHRQRFAEALEERASPD